LSGPAQVFVGDDLQYVEKVEFQACLIAFERIGWGPQLGARLRIEDSTVIEPTILLRYWTALRR